MKKYFLLYFCLVILILYEKVNARPISYPGGWTIMQMNDFKRHSIHIHLTPSINYSLGYRGEYWRKKKWQSHNVQLNYLIRRYNFDKSQANIYFKNGVGSAISSFEKFENKTEPNFFSGISVDWEDRRFFTSYENKINFNPIINSFFLQKARIGLAPYIGRYGELHTWLMFQVEHMPQDKNKLVYTPMLRMFKGDYLVEAGLSIERQFMFNFIKRF